LKILKYLMQNPAFWPYLKRLWCLKIIRFFFTLFCCLLSIWDLEFYLQLVQQVKCFMDWSWLYRVAKWTQTQNYKPFHWIIRENLHRGYKTSVHFRVFS
jgi:hypothetical protein